MDSRWMDKKLSEHRNSALNKKFQQAQYKKSMKKTQLKKINNLRDTIDSISSYLCTDWFVVQRPDNTVTTDPSKQSSFSNDYNVTQQLNTEPDITRLFGRIYQHLPEHIYKFWEEKPEVHDPIYGLDPDCESPHLFVSIEHGGYSPTMHKTVLSLYKWWGYFTEREIRHRCAMFSYMKAQRRCARAEFWDRFDLEDNFLVELQILAVHLWIIKTRMNHFAAPVCNQLSYEMFRIMFNEFGVRFEKHISGSRERWESDCQHACLYLAVALDQVWDNYQLNNRQTQLYHYNPYIFAKVIWSEIYLLNENISLDVLYLWSKYIFDEIMALRKVNDFEFLNGYWRFGELPTVLRREQTKADIVRFKEMIEVNASGKSSGEPYERSTSYDETRDDLVV